MFFPLKGQLESLPMNLNAQIVFIHNSCFDSQAASSPSRGWTVLKSRVCSGQYRNTLYFPHLYSKTPGMLSTPRTLQLISLLNHCEHSLTNRTPGLHPSLLLLPGSTEAICRLSLWGGVLKSIWKKLTSSWCLSGSGGAHGALAWRWSYRCLLLWQFCVCPSLGVGERDQTCRPPGQGDRIMRWTTVEESALSPRPRVKRPHLWNNRAVDWSLTAMFFLRDEKLRRLII